MIRDVTDLRVYQRALENLTLVYQLARQIPEGHRKLRRQLIEAAEGVPPQIAEGFAKRQSEKEFKRYLRIALGSSDETITHAREIYLLGKIVKTIGRDLCVKVGQEYKVISKQLNKLHKNWQDYTKL